jgi:digeranylgeranylglycerophospholipid reductase
MKHYDVVVIGAGPAGLCAGISAATAGGSVLVIDRRSEIGSPVRTSGGSWISEMKELGVPDSLYHPIDRVTFRSTNEEASFLSSPPQHCVLNVRGLYQYLAETALNQGAEIALRTRAIALLMEDRRVKGVKLSRFSEEMDVAANVVIDASGYAHFSHKGMGIDVAHRFGEGVEYELIAAAPQNETVLFVGEKVCRSGYAWLFPCGNSRVRIGVGLIRPDSLENPVPVLNEFIKANNYAEGFSEIEFHHGVVPSWGYLKKNVYGGLIIIGDAAGHLPLLVGEGIRFAMKAGLTAGKVAAQAVRKDNPSERALSGFKREWLNRHLLSFRISFHINKQISRFGDREWDKAIGFLSKMKPDVFFPLLKSDFSAPLIMSLAAALARPPHFLKWKG